MRRLSWWLLAFWGLWTLPGCGESAASKPTPQGPLRIAAASDLQSALPVLIAAFRAQNANRPIEIEAIYGSSVKLSQQIAQGGPLDLFLCANQKIVGDLAKLGAVDSASVRPYAKGSLVLIVGKTVEAKVSSIDDLIDPSIKKIALANPELAPYGMAAKQALQSAKLWDALQPKLVQSENVRQAVQFATTGNADAALVGRAVAVEPEVRIVEVDPALYQPLIQALGVVTESKRKADAEAFARFLLGANARAIFAQFGFTPAQAEAP
jgi:molybdate transport system substrate-binding protein